jgi:hypothetical protein
MYSSLWKMHLYPKWGVYMIKSMKEGNPQYLLFSLKLNVKWNEKKCNVVMWRVKRQDFTKSQTYQIAVTKFQGSGHVRLLLQNFKVPNMSNCCYKISRSRTCQIAVTKFQSPRHVKWLLQKFQNACAKSIQHRRKSCISSIQHCKILDMKFGKEHMLGMCYIVWAR